MWSVVSQIGCRLQMWNEVEYAHSSMLTGIQLSSVSIAEQQ